MIRYAASGRHRSGSRTGSPETGTRAGARNSPSRSARMDLAGVRRTVDSADTQPAMSASVRQVDQAAPQLWLLGPDDSGGSPQALCRTAASELPSRTPRVMIHSVTGWSSSRSASPRTRSATSIDRRTAQSTSALAGPGFGYVEDVSRLGDGGRRVTGIESSRSRSVRTTLSSPNTATGAQVIGQLVRVIMTLDGLRRVASRSRAPSRRGRRCGKAAALESTAA